MFIEGGGWIIGVRGFGRVGLTLGTGYAGCVDESAEGTRSEAHCVVSPGGKGC